MMAAKDPKYVEGRKESNQISRGEGPKSTGKRKGRSWSVNDAGRDTGELLPARAYVPPTEDKFIIEKYFASLRLDSLVVDEEPSNQSEQGDRG